MPVAPNGEGWAKIMAKAIQEACKAPSLGEIPVGALVLDPYGKIIAAAHNLVESLNDPTAHAEIMALREACRLKASPRLPDCVLVSTLEPCCMCAGAILQAGLAGVVYGAWDARAGCVSSALECFNSGLPYGEIWHMGGVLAGQCARLLEDFFVGKRKGQKAE